MVSYGLPRQSKYKLYLHDGTNMKYRNTCTGNNKLPGNTDDIFDWGMQEH
jgi:hypothetical protein